MTPNDAPVTKMDQSQERERVLELIEAVDAARAAFQAKQRQIEASPFEHMTVSMTPEEYALQRTMHAAETRIEKLGLDTARKYADALAELERVREALEKIEVAAHFAVQMGLETDWTKTMGNIARAALAPENASGVSQAAK